MMETWKERVVKTEIREQWYVEIVEVSEGVFVVDETNPAGGTERFENRFNTMDEAAEWADKNLT